MRGESTAWFAAISWGIVQAAAQLVRSVRDFLAQPLPDDRSPIIGHPWYSTRDKARGLTRACSQFLKFEFEMPAAFCSIGANQFTTDTKACLSDATWPSELTTLKGRFDSLRHAFRELEWILLFDRLDDVGNLSASDARSRNHRKTRRSSNAAESNLKEKAHRLSEGMIEFERAAIRLRDELLKLERTSLRSQIVNRQATVPIDVDRSRMAVVKRLGVRNENEVRDAWIYDQVQAGRPWKEIMSDFLRNLKSEGWEEIASIAGLRAAANRYVARNDVPEIKRRNRGGPRSKG